MGRRGVARTYADSKSVRDENVHRHARLHTPVARQSLKEPLRLEDLHAHCVCGDGRDARYGAPALGGDGGSAVRYMVVAVHQQLARLQRPRQLVSLVDEWSVLRGKHVLRGHALVPLGVFGVVEVDGHELTHVLFQQRRVARAQVAGCRRPEQHGQLEHR